MPESIKFVSGLVPYKKDFRDFKFEKVFGSIVGVPDYCYKPLEFKEQGSTDFCVSFACTGVAEYQDEKILDPVWFFSKIKQIEGNYWTYGADFKSAGQAGVKYGFLPKEFTPYKIEDNNRHFLANYKNWSDDLEVFAFPYKKKSYFFVSPGFQSIVSAGYLNKTPLVVGTNWHSNWHNSSNGIIEDTNHGSALGLHAIKYCGKETRGNARYALIQDSYGPSKAPDGLYRFRDTVIDKLFKMTPLVFVDLSPEEAKKLDWNSLQRLYNLISKTLSKIAIAINGLYEETKKVQES